MIAESVRVPMRDGVLLSAHVWRPDETGTWPAIISYTPYRKGPLRGCPSIVEHGYAVVAFDIRGTGDSAGWNDSIYSDPERQDGVAMIEWTAAQPWCSGKVGMWGISFGAVVALQMAAAAPDALKAIIARSGSDDPWSEWTNPAGFPRPYLYANYAPIMTAANFSPPDPAVVGAEWAAIWRQRLDHSQPWGISFLEHLGDSDFWRRRSLRGRYDRVQAAVYVVGGWADWYPSPLLRIFASLPGPAKALVGPWCHQWPDNGIPGPRINWTAEARRWFDYWLKEEDTGIMDEPPVTLFRREYSPPETILMRDRGRWCTAADWPPPQAQAMTLHLGARGRLDADPAGDDEPPDPLPPSPLTGIATGWHGGGAFNLNWAMPLDQRTDEPGSLVYTTDPLVEHLDIVGCPQLHLHIETGDPVTQWAAKLCDVAPDGVSALVTKGFARATTGMLSLDVSLLGCAYRFRPGHRIRLMIAPADAINLWPVPGRAPRLVHHDAGRQSRLILPYVPAATDEPPAVLDELDEPMPARDDLAAPELTQTRDLIADTLTFHHRVEYGPRWSNQADYTVSARHPECATIDGRSRCEHHYPGMHIVVDAVCTTTSDATSFHHTAAVEITLNGAPYYHRSWATSVPRRDF